MRVEVRLRAIKMNITPRRAAVEYLDWMHGLVFTQPPSPVRRLLDQMNTEIRARCERWPERKKAHLEATRELCHLIATYCLAAPRLVDELHGLVQFETFAVPYCVDRPSSPELVELLADRRNRVALTYAMVQEFEKQFLHAGVFPKYLHDLVALRLERAEATRTMIDPSDKHNLFMPSAECSDWARANLPTFRSTSKWGGDKGRMLTMERLHFLEAAD